MGYEKRIPSFFVLLARNVFLARERTDRCRDPGLAGLHELVAQHSSQPEQAGAEQGQRAGLGNGGRRARYVVVGDRDRAIGITGNGLIGRPTRDQ